MQKLNFKQKPPANYAIYNKLPEEARGRIPDKKILDLMPWDLVSELRAFVFGKNEAGVKIAALNPESPALKHYVQERFGNNNVEWFNASDDDIAFILKNHQHDFKGEISALLASHPDANGNLAGTRFLRHRLYKLIRPFLVPFGEYRRRHFKFGVDSVAIVIMYGLVNSIYQFS